LIERGLSEGDRLKVNGEYLTLVEYDYNSDRFSWSNDGYWNVKYDDGRTERLTAWGLHRGNLVYDKEALKLGDRVEVKLEDPMVDSFPRGKIIAIDPEHAETPYTVESLDGKLTTKFAAFEINKILTALSWEKRGDSKKALEKLVAEKRAELQALEIALEVLEFAAGADKG
jgi:hypothetical protein